MVGFKRAIDSHIQRNDAQGDNPQLRTFANIPIGDEFLHKGAAFEKLNAKEALNLITEQVETFDADNAVG